jgi:glycosyltransferase domain-containing protein
VIAPVAQTSSQLTVILPTRNRPRYCAAQLRFFKDCGLAHPIVVADSGDPADAQAVRDACAGIAQYRRFDPSIGVVEKFITTLRAIETPFVVTAPDDDVTFPHAIDAALAHLRQNPDFIAAHGYVLRFGMHEDDFDIHNVSGFAPTIGHDEPLQRLYHLIRRYQPIIWAVFRTETFAAAMKAARGVDGFIFQELTFAATAALGGKIARLPLIFSMRGKEESMSPLDQIHPLFWFLRDAGGFFEKYRAYRAGLVQRIRREALAAKPVLARLRARVGMLRHGAAVKSDLQQVLDLVHAAWLGRELDLGILEHTVRQRLGDALPAIHIAPVWPGWREPTQGDAVHSSPRGDRRYVWRREVLAAEPREEIKITPDEMARIERELDAYRLE